MGAVELDIDVFQRVLGRLDEFLLELLPIVDRGTPGVVIARDKARGFAIAEAKPGPFDNLYRWDETDRFGSFSEFLDGPHSQEWREYVPLPTGVWCDVPLCRQRILKFVPVPTCEAACKTAESLLDFVTDRRERSTVLETLRREALDYLECRGVRVETDDDRLAKYQDPLTPLGKRILKALWSERYAVEFETLRTIAWEGADVLDATIVRRLKDMEARWAAADLFGIDLEISAAARLVKLVKNW